MGIRIAFILSIILLLSASRQTNHPPSIKIESPSNNAVLSVNTPATYQVKITDQEDGDTRYDEINPKEVIWELAPFKSGVNSAAQQSPLDIISTNNCFNCHEYNARSLGPSFLEIALRYHATAAITDTLTRHIKDGSSGIWGRTEKMPSHPELSTAAIRSTVRWILQSAARADHAYFTGITGILHFPSDKPGTYTLTATYIDHGPKNQPGPHLKAYNKIIVSLK